MTTQRRKRARTPYHAHALIRTPAKRTIKAMVRDVSLESVYLFCDHGLIRQPEVKLEIVLVGRDSELIVKAPGVVARRDETGIAIRFRSALEWWPLFTYFSMRQIDQVALKAFFRRFDE